MGGRCSCHYVGGKLLWRRGVGPKGDVGRAGGGGGAIAKRVHKCAYYIDSNKIMTSYHHACE